MTNTKKRKTVLVETEFYDYECGDGCCYEWGYRIYINGKALIDQSEDMTLGIVALLEEQGYEVDARFRENRGGRGA